MTLSERKPIPARVRGYWPFPDQRSPGFVIIKDGPSLADTVVMTEFGMRPITMQIPNRLKGAEINRDGDAV